MQPVASIEVQAPVPSILTTARDRSGDQFGTRKAPDVDAAPIMEQDGGPAVEQPEAAKYSWRTGVAWRDTSCQPSRLWPNCPSTDEIEAGKDGSDFLGIGPVEVSPFWIYTPLECDLEPFALDRAELTAAANALSDAHAAWAVARALWLGEGLPASNNTSAQPSLRSSAVDVTPGGGAVDLDDAVALLLAHYEVGTGGNGGSMLHVPSIAMTALLGAIPGGSTVARLVGTHYEGPLGSLVSPGPGYPFGASDDGADGFGPLIDPDTPADGFLGSDVDEVWVYVTGPVEYALGPLEPVEPPLGAELRRNSNEIWSERQAIVRFDPCSTFACLANLPLSYVEPS